MKVFSVKLMSNYDIISNFFNAISHNKITKPASEPDSVLINNTIKILKKGRNICDKLSE